MGKEVRGVPEAPPLTLAEEAGGVGRYLAKQRRLRGISLAELAALTRIPQRSIERLESGAFDEKNDGFARGFVRTVAAALGLDPDETVMRMAHEPEDDSLEPRRRWRAPGAATLARVALAALAVILAVALVRLAAGWLEPSAEPVPDTVLRRDPVRALAGEETVRPSGREP